MCAGDVNTHLMRLKHELAKLRELPRGQQPLAGQHALVLANDVLGALGTVPVHLRMQSLPVCRAAFSRLRIATVI